MDYSEVWNTLYARHQQAEALIANDHVDQGLREIVSILDRIARLEEKPGEFKQLETACLDVLNRTHANMLFSLPSVWNEQKANDYVYIWDHNKEPVPLQFMLLYKGRKSVFSFPVPYSIKIICGDSARQYLYKTDARGQGRVPVAAYYNPKHVLVVELSFFYSVDDYCYTFPPQYRFTYPARQIVVSVKTGERVIDLALQLEQMYVSTVAALYTIASQAHFNEYWFVPGRMQSISRFEGLFRPGTYEFSIIELPLLYTSPAPKKQALANTLLILHTLLNVSAGSYAALDTVQELSAYKQITLASIVEKEAVANIDYEIIASVFFNRLKMGDYLASCPTVEYALGYHRPFLTRYDISISTPYNVYRKKGLPPTPICFFSDAALNAVNKPLHTDYYFFVYDWTTRRLYFADTYTEHKENIKLARSNFIGKYGRNELFRISYDKFYEE
ncbi:MAG: endolytic transglycosylase MltG [Spirochaetales bacterium]|nr:endolytic transglycosylase MltG [Spirochaetales bacterium]